MQLMVSATLVLLCTRPLEVAVFGQLPWLLIIPSITIIGREVMHTYVSYLQFLGFYYLLNLSINGTYASSLFCISLSYSI